MSQGNARWGVGATGTPGPTGPPGPAGPPGAGASGAALFELAPVDSPIFIGRYTPGSGVMQQMSPPTAVGMLPVFSLVAKGLVPAPVTSSGRVLQDDGTWVAQSGGTPSGVTLAQQAVAGPQTIQGRTTLGTGTREDLSAGQVASLIGGRFGSGLQLLMAPTAIRGGMLRDDGQWVLPSFVPSGLAPGQLLPLSPLTVVGRFTAGSGTREELRGDQIASMIGKFAGTGLGLVPTPTGGAQARFLGDNGQWAIPLASGITNAQLSIKPPSVILGRSGSTGIVEELVGSGVATLLPLFNDIHKGLVPGSAGGTTAFLRADGSWAIPSTSGGVSGVAFNQIQDISAPRFLGRLSGSGSIQELTPGQGASLIPPFFASGARGVVLGPTGGAAGAFLRDDGAWATPAGGTATGVSNDQLGVMPPFTLKGRTTLGSGIPEDLTKAQVASLLPRFGGSGVGQVPAPTGGNVRSFLRDDGQWQIPLASGIANSQLGAMLAPTVKGRFTLGSGVPEDLTGAQVASMIQNFSTTTAGLVPVPTLAAATGAFLDNRGRFSTPTGLSNGQLALMPPSRIKGSSGTTGLPEDLVGSMVSTLLPLFNDVDKGLVPGSLGGTSAFLRADGNWATPPVGGSPSGILFNQLQDITGNRFLGRRPIGSGAIEELTREQVATMLPVFSGALRGMVPPPAGGGPSGFFLKDDSTWFPLLGPEITGPVTTGFGTAAGSMTIDFSAGPYHVRELGGNTKFYLTPPSMMRHTQLRTRNGASGVCPTFFGSMVKWAGGSAMHPSLFNRASGAINIMNFSWDGQFMNATVGAGFG